MTPTPPFVRRSPRVYYRWLFVLPLLLLLLAPRVSPAQAPLELTVTPSMVKGSASAPVTIIEFSDYQ